MTIPLSEPDISGNEWKYVKDCLDTGWVSSVGSYVDLFEEKIAEYTGAKYAVAVSTGTSAIHVSLIACGVVNGDEVVVPSLTFIAPVNCVRYVGANPLFVDCDPGTLCIDAKKVWKFLENNTKKGADGFTYNIKTRRRVKALIPVHVFGHPCNMDDLVKICNEYNLRLIEDATESLGSLYKGKNTGTFGDIGCFSFNGNKIITTGSGGMVVTNDKDIADNVRHLTTQAKCDAVEYDHDDIGYNYRMSNVSAAIGVAQLEKLDEFIAVKRENVLIYSDLFKDVKEVRLLSEKEYVKSNFWFYTIMVNKSDKQPLMDFLIKNNIQVRPVWKVISSLSMYRHCQNYEIVNSKDIYDTSINLPCSLNLKEKDIRLVVEKIKDFFNGKVCL